MVGTWIESLKKKSIKVDVCTIVETGDSRIPMRNFILHEQLPDDPQGARKMRTTAPRSVLTEDQLYKTMGNWPLLKCLTPEEGKYILQEIHEGICGSHIEDWRTLIRNFILCEQLPNDPQEARKIRTIAQGL